MKECSINKCESKHYGKGYCSKHYWRLYRHGNTNKITFPEICSIKVCENKCHAKGYCDKHYAKFKKYGDPLFLVLNVYHQPLCVIYDCENKYYGNGYCEKHYQKWRKYGDPLKVSSVFNRKCDINGCNKKHFGKGYCQNHYSKEYPEIQHKANVKRLIKLGKVLGITSIEYTYANKSWSQIVKKLDSYTCQICGITGTSKTLHAHHIFFVSLYPKLSLNLNNGISLCIPCHEELHGFSIY